MKRTCLLTLLIVTAGGGITPAKAYMTVTLKNTIGMKFNYVDPALSELKYHRPIGPEERPMTIVQPVPFPMGQTEGGDWDEHPVHEVTISGGFFISVTEVTNTQYEQFDPDHRKFRGRLGYSKGDDEAVVFVSWHDAVNFCKWLSKKEGEIYRLPTEAEWEYACRAGTTTPYHTGDELPKAFQKNVRTSWFPDPARSRDSDVVALTVGQTPPNPWGIYDMHGNVEEWCYDWYGPYEDSRQTDPVGRSTGNFKVTRGGSHSTELRYLRSANRSGTLPEDKSWYIGFRVVQAELPKTEPLPPAATPLNARNVKQGVPGDLAKRPDPKKPYFKGPILYVKIPPGSNGPIYSGHNHDPALINCPNGDLLAIWYSCNSEPGRELAIVASRLRYGSNEWEPATPFWDAPDRNDHAPALWYDGRKTIYHFNGLAAAATWGNLATIMRTSTDSGATWSKARLINPTHGLRHMPVQSVFKSSEGFIILPCDAVTGGSGGTAACISRDNGQTWYDPGEGQPKPTFKAGEKGGWIAGIHAGITQLRNGNLMALGRGDTIDGHMPMSISDDMGKSWIYSASPFQPIGSGQRLVLRRLREGPILVVTFADRRKGLLIADSAGGEKRIYGMFAALSFDEGKTWPVKRLLTVGGPPREIDGGGNTGKFIMDDTHAEPKGYLAATQTPDNVIHLISSKQHYAFNLAWLTQNSKASKKADFQASDTVMDHIRGKSGPFFAQQEQPE